MILEKYIGEASKPKWANDPYKFRSELVKRLKEISEQIEDIWISEDRYYPGFEQNKQHYNQVNKAFSMFDKGITQLESIAKKAPR